jgi:hypothetical protein
MYAWFPAKAKVNRRGRGNCAVVRATAAKTMQVHGEERGNFHAPLRRRHACRVAKLDRCHGVSAGHSNQRALSQCNPVAVSQSDVVSRITERDRRKFDQSLCRSSKMRSPSLIGGGFSQCASNLQSELAEVCDASVKACLCSHQQQTTNRVFKVGRFTKCGCDSYAGGDQQQGSLFDRDVPERGLACGFGHVRAPQAATAAKRDGRCSTRFGPDRVFAAIVVLLWNGGGQGGRGVLAPRSSATYRQTPDA